MSALFPALEANIDITYTRNEKTAFYWCVTGKQTAEMKWTKSLV